MILPQSYTFVLVLTILALFCLGSWASFYKFAGKWRFELFYFDFAVGLMVAAVIYAFTVGNLGYDGFSFIDDLQHAGKRQWMNGVLAGMIFNLGNMLLMAAVSIGGLAIAFPMTLGIAMIVGTLVGLAARPGNTMLVGLGCALILTSVLVNAMLYRIKGIARHEELARSGHAKSTRRPSPLKGIILCVLAGVLLGAFTPLLDKARVGDLGLGPYALAFLFCLGVAFSSFVFNIFFMNLPIEGDPVDFGAYVNGRLKQHLYGVFAGVVWCTGIVAAMVCTISPEPLQPAPLTRFMLLQGAPVLAALWGILMFREFRTTDVRVKSLGALMLVLFLCGMVMIGLAPLYLRKI